MIKYTHEILELINEHKNKSEKLNWLEKNNWKFKICTKKNNPFNERLDYWRLANSVCELETRIKKQKLKLFNYYKNNYVKKINVIFW